jgi:lipoyl(octanoyl) transferase
MISVVQLGTLDYSTGLALQHSLVQLRKEGRVSDALLLLEHAPVITLGRNASREHLLASPDLLAEKGVELFDCDRGGDITFHGPGQLVGYPIFDLRGFTPRVGAVEFVRRLEEVLIRTCAAFRISAMRIPGLTGVWTSDGSKTATSAPRGSRDDSAVPAKIAAIGIHISRGITSHGFALNVNTDLDYFKLIVPCGIQARPVTSLADELGHQVALDDVARCVAGEFAGVFGVEVRWVNELAELTGATVGLPATAPQDVRRVSREEDLFLA